MSCNFLQDCSLVLQSSSVRLLFLSASFLLDFIARSKSASMSSECLIFLSKAFSPEVDEFRGDYECWMRSTGFLSYMFLPLEFLLHVKAEIGFSSRSVHSLFLSSSSSPATHEFEHNCEERMRSIEFPSTWISFTLKHRDKFPFRDKLLV